MIKNNSKKFLFFITLKFVHNSVHKIIYKITATINGTSFITVEVIFEYTGEKTYTLNILKRTIWDLPFFFKTYIVTYSENASAIDCNQTYAKSAKSQEPNNIYPILMHPPIKSMLNKG